MQDAPKDRLYPPRLFPLPYTQPNPHPHPIFGSRIWTLAEQVDDGYGSEQEEEEDEGTEGVVDMCLYGLGLRLKVGADNKNDSQCHFFVVKPEAMAGLAWTT